jgi:hypothetical protein
LKDKNQNPECIAFMQCTSVVNHSIFTVQEKKQNQRPECIAFMQCTSVANHSILRFRKKSKTKIRSALPLCNAQAWQITQFDGSGKKAKPKSGVHCLYAMHKRGKSLNFTVQEKKQNQRPEYIAFMQCTSVVNHSILRFRKKIQTRSSHVQKLCKNRLQKSFPK